MKYSINLPVGHNEANSQTGDEAAIVIYQEGIQSYAPGPEDLTHTLRLAGRPDSHLWIRPDQ